MFIDLFSDSLKFGTLLHVYAAGEEIIVVIIKRHVSCSLYAQLLIRLLDWCRNVNKQKNKINKYYNQGIAATNNTAPSSMHNVEKLRQP